MRDFIKKGFRNASSISSDHPYPHAYQLLQRTQSYLCSMTSFCKSSVRGNCYVIPLLCPAILFFIIVSTSCRHIEVRPPAPSVPSKCFSDTGIAFAAFSPSTKAGLGLYIICHGLIAQPLLFHVQFRFQSRFQD